MLHELKPPEILGIHFQTFEGRYLIELVKGVPPERVLNTALDEGYGYQALAARDRQDLMEAIGRIDDRLTRLEFEGEGWSSPEAHLRARLRHNPSDR